jgi:hypothetical protein
MKITDLSADLQDDLLVVSKATYIGDFVVRLSFSDKTEKLIDFKAFLSHAPHPLFLKYQDEKTFKKFKIVNGNLNWNDYEMIFPIEALYEGKIH